MVDYAGFISDYLVDLRDYLQTELDNLGIEAEVVIGSKRVGAPYPTPGIGLLVKDVTRDQRIHQAWTMLLDIVAIDYGCTNALELPLIQLAELGATGVSSFGDDTNTSHATRFPGWQTEMIGFSPGFKRGSLGYTSWIKISARVRMIEPQPS